MEHSQSKPNIKVSDEERLTSLRESIQEADRRAEDESDRGYVSYEDAYKKELARLGISESDLAFVEAAKAPKDQVEKSFEIHVQPGPSVELGARALALNNIMQTLNQANKARGAAITSQFADSQFSRRYGVSAEDVQLGMVKKADHMLRGNEEDFDTLTATDDMIVAGVSDSEVQRMKDRLKYDIIDQYGPGRATAKDRAKLVRTAESTARAVNRKH